MTFVSRLIVGTFAILFSLGASAQQPQPVGPYKDFKGIINLDIRDSKADWGQRPRDRFLFRISLEQQAQRFFAFDRIVHDFGPRCHGQAGDFHHLRRVVIDRERNAVVTGKIGRFLAGFPAQEIDRKALIGVADRGYLGQPSGRSVGIRMVRC